MNPTKIGDQRDEFPDVVVRSPVIWSHVLRLRLRDSSEAIGRTARMAGHTVLEPTTFGMPRPERGACGVELLVQCGSDDEVAGVLPGPIGMVVSSSHARPKPAHQKGPQ